MGYDLHITRKRNWFEDESGTEISFDEWMAVINADPELRPEGYIDRCGADNNVVRQPLVAWTAHSCYRPDNPGPALDHWGGNVSAKNPDEEFIGKMWRLAQTLNAKVRGDDGEFYDQFGNGSEEA